jgi:hypothetical protein
VGTRNRKRVSQKHGTNGVHCSVSSIRSLERVPNIFGTMLKRYIRNNGNKPTHLLFSTFCKQHDHLFFSTFCKQPERLLSSSSPLLILERTRATPLLLFSATRCPLLFTPLFLASSPPSIRSRRRRRWRSLAGWRGSRLGPAGSGAASS